MSDCVHDAAGFVLAGGASSRMGTDKALVKLGGRPLVEHSLATLREAGLEAAIAGARSDLSAFGPVVDDTEPGCGPLGGVCAALASTQAGWAVFLSVDLPLAPAALLDCLLCRAETIHAAVALCSVSGFPQTFPAVVHRDALPVLREDLMAGRRGCFAAFRAAADRLSRPLDAVAAESLGQCGQVRDPRGLPAAFWFLNANSPQELERAERLHSRRIA